MRYVTRQNRTTKVELTEKERRTLRHIIDKFYSQLDQDTKERGLPILMSDKDAELIKELGDFARDICITHY